MQHNSWQLWKFSFKMRCSLLSLHAVKITIRNSFCAVIFNWYYKNESHTTQFTVKEANVQIRVSVTQESYNRQMFQNVWAKARNACACHVSKLPNCGFRPLSSVVLIRPAQYRGNTCGDTLWHLYVLLFAAACRDSMLERDLQRDMHASTFRRVRSPQSEIWSVWPTPLELQTCATSDPLNQAICQTFYAFETGP